MAIKDSQAAGGPENKPILDVVKEEERLLNKESEGERERACVFVCEGWEGGFE